MPQTQWSRELHQNIFHEKTTCGDWSKKLHEYKHKNCQNTYEDQVQDFISTHVSDKFLNKLDCDLFSAPFRPPSPDSDTSSASSQQEKRPLQNPLLGLHIQTGNERERLPWLPPFLRSPPTSPTSPGVWGVAASKPGLLARTGGGYVARKCKQLGQSGRFKRFKWGPALVPPDAGTRCAQTAEQTPAHRVHFSRRPRTEAAAQTRAQMLSPDRTLPSLAERALWSFDADGERFATNAGLNYKQRFDQPRESLHLTNAEAQCLFDQKTMPLTPSLQKAKVIASPGPPVHLGHPVRRPFTSQDLYRLSQFCCTERASVN